jgi:hypothetical protein
MDIVVKKFTENLACTSRFHCHACRTDEKFRAGLMQAFDWDGECPYGVTADTIPERKMPPVTEQVKNLTQAVTRAVGALVTGNQVIADEETRRNRIAICEGCEMLQGWSCSKCGCSTPAKVALQTEKCPMAKW